MQTRPGSLAVALERRLDGKLAAAWHRLVSVQHQVEQRLFEHFAIERHWGQVGGKVGLDLDVRLASSRAEEAHHLVDDGSKTGGASSRSLTRAKRSTSLERSTSCSHSFCRR